MFRSDWLRFAFATVVVALAAPACSLPAPQGIVGGGDGGAPTGQCPVVASTDAGVDSGTGVIVSADPTTVVTPMSCAGTGANPNAIDRYTQGYTPSADVTQQVAKAVSSMSLHDLALQMEGMPYNSTGQFSDTQRSQDTGSIRGFRYRDASRGMNLGEDMNGSFPNADHHQRVARRLLDRLSRSAWPVALRSIWISSTPSARPSATRCRRPSRPCCWPLA